MKYLKHDLYLNKSNNYCDEYICKICNLTLNVSKIMTNVIWMSDTDVFNENILTCSEYLIKQIIE